MEKQSRKGWGLFALHADSRSIEPVTDSHDKAFLEKQLVRFLYPNTHDGLLWIGTQTGLYIYNKDTRAYRHLTTTDGLADNLVKAIGSDQHGNVWISSDSTLTRLTPTADGNYLCQPYRRSDGIGDGIFHVRAIASMADGTLLFGTSKGCLTVRNANGALPVKARSAPTLQTLLLPFLLLLVVIIINAGIVTVIHYYHSSDMSFCSISRSSKAIINNALEAYSRH